MPKKYIIEFDGWDDPNFVPAPQIFYDHYMAHLTLAETRVLLYLFRRTYGFQRSSDTISISQMCNGMKSADGKKLDDGTNMSKRSILPALKSLEAKGMIKRERQSDHLVGDKPTRYSLRFRGDPPMDRKIRKAAWK